MGSEMCIRDSYYRVAGVAVGGKGKGQAENEEPPVDIRGLLP